MEHEVATVTHRQFSLKIYLVIVFALSWPFQFAAILYGVDMMTRYAFTSISMVMVAVGTFICDRLIFRDGFSDAGWQWGKFRHYLTVIGFVVFLWVVPSLIAIALGRSLPSTLTDTMILYASILLTVTIVPAFGEEFGWRGYMLPNLARHFRAVKAIEIQGVIWAAWHIPILMAPAIQSALDTVTAAVLVILAMIPAVLHGVVFAYIWSSTRSLAVVTVYHAAYDGVRETLQMILGFGAMTFLWVNVSLMVVGIVLLRVGKWKSVEEFGGNQ